MLLMLFMPAHKVQLDTISQFNGVDLATTRQDIAEVASEIQRFYHLELNASADDYYQINGSRLDKRLCLIHWLRRGLRYCPHFIEHYFSPTYIKRWRGIMACWRRLCDDQLYGNQFYDNQFYDNQFYGNQLYDNQLYDKSFTSVNSHLNRQLSEKIVSFATVFGVLCLGKSTAHRATIIHDPTTMVRTKPARVAADHLFNSLNRLLIPPLGLIERDMLILMLTMIKAHHYHSTQSPEDARLIAAIKQLIHRFKRLSGMHFSCDDSLVSQLFAHLAPPLSVAILILGSTIHSPKISVRCIPVCSVPHSRR